MRRAYTYTYEVVTHNGAGCHSRGHKSPRSARAAMERIASAYPLPGEVFEIHRTRHLGNGTRHYSMRSRSRWVEWNPHRDHEAREPDWFAESR